MKEKILGLRRNVFFLGLTSLFNDFSSEMVLSVLPAFFISVLKTGAQSLGLVEGVADAAANFIKIYSGRFSDKIEKRKIFAVIGYSISVCSRPFYLFAGSVGGVIGLRIVDRIGKGFRDSPRDALISLSTPKEELGKSFGYHRAMDTTGAILGPLAAYLLLTIFPANFSLVFITSFVVGLVAIFSLALVKDVQVVLEARKESREGSRLSRVFFMYIASIFVLALGTLPVPILLFKTLDFGLSIASIPLFYMIYNIAYALFSIPAGTFADRLGSAKVIAVGYFLLIGSYIVFIFSSSLLVLVAGFLLVGLFSAFTDGVQRSHLSLLIDEGARGTAYGYFNAASGFGALIAGGVGGYLWQEYSETTALFAGIAMLALGLIIFTFHSYVKKTTIGA